MSQGPAPDGEPIRIGVPIESTGYFRLSMPERLPDGPAAVVIALHGYAQPPLDMLAYARSVAPADAIVIAPEGPSSFYTRRQRMPDGTRKRAIRFGWIADLPRQPAEARNRNLIRRAIEAAASQHPVDTARTFLLGYSQGVGVAVDYFTHNPAQVAGLVGLAGGIPAHGRGRASSIAGSPVLWITGTEDESYPPTYCDALIEDLERVGVAPERIILPTGHDLLDDAREQVGAWLSAHCCAPA